MLVKVSAQISERALDRLGDWNPQLMREWQGRSRSRNLLMATLPAIGVQALILLQRLAELPNQFAKINRYCSGSLSDSYDIQRYCNLTENSDRLNIQWSMFWSDVFRDISVTLPWVLIVGGVFLLIADFSKENRRGTLNFLRMSPASSRQILLGKLLGVPVLLYSIVAVTLPLHIGAGLAAGFSGLALGEYYLVLAATMFCFYAAALWFASLTPKLQGAGPWLGALVVLLLLLLGMVITDSSGTTVLNWSTIFNPIYSLSFFDSANLEASRSYWPFTGNNAFSTIWFTHDLNQVSYLALVLTNTLGLGLWFWCLLERRFQAPALSPLGKRQSYGLTLFLSVMALGFGMDQFNVADYQGYRYNSHDIQGFIVTMVIWSLMLMYLLLPSQQSLLDWARYRRQSKVTPTKAGQTQTTFDSTVSRNLFWDLRCHENSPTELAFVLNLAIIGGVLATSLAIFWTHNSDYHLVLLSWLFSAFFLYSCLAMVQLLSLSNYQHRHWMSVGGLVTVMAGLPVGLTMLGLYPNAGTAMLWLLTIAPQSVVESSGTLALLFALGTHLAIAGSLTWVLTKRLRHLGQSEWKALLTNSSRKDLAGV